MINKAHTLTFLKSIDDQVSKSQSFLVSLLMYIQISEQLDLALDFRNLKNNLKVPSVDSKEIKVNFMFHQMKQFLCTFRFMSNCIIQI